MYNFYKILTSCSEPALNFLLQRRLADGKEDVLRINERRGIASLPRPDGRLIWFHAASVGEAQSTLILINRLLSENPQTKILVTTGTLTSAKVIGEKLPDRAFHQFYPLDHPEWTARFLNHWRPDVILWMESELWPNMLMQVRERSIPMVLINARLSPTSFKRWKLFGATAERLLSGFAKILCQTETDAQNFRALGAQNVHATGNLKFSAQPLPFDKADLQTLSARVTGRPLWLYASTHKGEEELACRIHEIVKNSIPDLLTIIVPRHPERREDIAAALKSTKLRILFRGTDKTLPREDTDLYIADTLGELGLFYRVAPIACIGRSFSDDGGGGHNPIEAAQLGCAVIHGPHVQNLQDIYTLMGAEGASLRLADEGQFEDILHELLSDPDRLKILQNKGLNFTRAQNGVVDVVFKEISSVITAQNTNPRARPAHAS